MRSRKSVTDTVPAPGAADNLSSSTEQQRAGGAAANRALADFWAMELAFRLGSLQRWGGAAAGGGGGGGRGAGRCGQSCAGWVFQGPAALLHLVAAGRLAAA